jgi:hypothetical protein
LKKNLKMEKIKNWTSVKVVRFKKSCTEKKPNLRLRVFSAQPLEQMIN